jgi:glycyl-tRNA synthetase beta chain
MAIDSCIPVLFPLRISNPIFKKPGEAFVIVDPVERKKRIEEGMIREGAKVSGRILKDEELLNEVNFLLEYPVALCGTFDSKFLSLPREILIHSMKEHQRYFPLVDDHGVLLPHFVCISNIHPKASKW